MAKLSSINKNEARKKLVAKTDEEARELLRLFNFPFPAEEQREAA